MNIIDVENSCRTCLSFTAALESIFDSKISLIITKLLPEITKISPSDVLSKKICVDCKNKIMTFHSFSQLCVTSDKNMRMLIGSQSPKIVVKDQSDFYEITKNFEEDLNEDTIEYEPEEEEFEPVQEPEVIVNIKLKPPKAARILTTEGIIIQELDPPAPIKLRTRSIKKEEELTFAIIVDPEVTSNDIKTSTKLQSDIYKCDLCSKNFVKYVTLKTHILQVHDVSRHKYTCDKCPRKFRQELLLKRHSIYHSELLAKSKIVRTEKSFKCICCKAEFGTLQFRLKHYRSEHRDDNFECDYCELNLPNLREFLEHSKKHVENAIFKCVICAKPFTVLLKFISHLMNHEGMKLHVCEFEGCDKSFMSKAKLKDHMISHATNSKPHLCSLCGQFYKTKENLARHMIRHSGVKNFSCNYCPKSFFFNRDLTAHTSLHLGLKNHLCSLCATTFTTKSALRNHNRDKHTGVKDFPCDVCEMKFSTAGVLKKHSRVHTGEKPYPCTHGCSKSFPTSGQMVKHLRTHLGKNVYQCEYCSEAFPKHGELKKHWRIHFDKTLSTNQQNMELYTIQDISIEIIDQDMIEEDKDS